MLLTIGCTAYCILRTTRGFKNSFLSQCLTHRKGSGVYTYKIHAGDTVEEIGRKTKRAACLNNIRNANYVERYQRKHKVLTNIVHRREKKRRRRQRREDMMGWPQPRQHSTVSAPRKGAASNAAISARSAKPV